MRTNFKFAIAACVAAAMFTGCSKSNEGPDGPEGPTGKTTNVQLLIQEAGQSGTYAAGNVTEPASGQESKISTVSIYVFDNDGLYEYAKTGITLDGSDKTPTFQLSTGNKYFYVFTNIPTGSIATPVTGTTREAFEKQILTATVTENGNTTSISEDNNFFIGTLWAGKTAVTGVGDPEEIPLTIGRVSAKAVLATVVNQATGNIKGTFSNASYRIGSIPTKYYLVGQHTAAVAPPVGTNAGVTSAVHTEAAETSPGSGTQNPVFKNYKNYAGLNDAFYLIENTTQKISGSLYYGNTTYMQLKVKYAPTAAEIRKGTDGTAGGTLPGDGTFFTATINGELLIFDASPSVSIPGLDATSIKEYTEGYNYYKMPIKDLSEVGIENQCVILRNHFYTMDVNTISRLGDNDDTVDPGEPIEEDKDVVVKVTILNWSKVSQGIDF